MASGGRLVVAGIAAAWLAVGAGVLAAGAAGAAAPPVRCLLTANVDIEGVPCAAGYAWRFPDGRLQRCTLARSARVRGAVLPARTIVVFAPNGSCAQVFLPETTMVEGHACRGGGHSYMTGFHPNGRLKLCWLDSEETIQGVPCARASFLGELFHRSPSGVELAADGRLVGCRASRDFSVNGSTYVKGERVGLDRSGRVRPVGWGLE
jgi:hypothetical protein